MSYLLIARRHTGHRVNSNGRPRCSARGAGLVVDELPPNRVPCHLCEPEAATPVVEVKSRDAKVTQGARKRRAKKGARTS